MLDCTDSRRRDAIGRRQVGSALTPIQRGADSPDIASGQLRPGIPFSPRATHRGPPSLVHVPNILDGTPTVEVGGILAGRIVAGVERPFFVGQGALEFQRQGDAVSLDGLPVPIVDLTVTLPIERPNPGPALVISEAQDVAVIPIQQRLFPAGLVCHLAGLAARAAPLSDFKWPDGEDGAAYGADSGEIALCLRHSSDYTQSARMTKGGN